MSKWLCRVKIFNSIRFFFTLLPYSPSSDCVLLIEWGVMQISKTLGSGRKKRTKSATATTDLMLGMMDLKIGNDIQH